MYQNTNYVFILDIDFIKNLMVSLERLFIRLSTLLPDDDIKVKCNKLMDKLKYNIRIIVYDKKILDNHTLNNSSMQQLHTLNKKRVTGIENAVPNTSVKSDVNHSIQSPVQNNQQKKEMDGSCNLQNNINSETLIDHHLTKKPKLISSDVLNRSTTSGI